MLYYLYTLFCSPIALALYEYDTLGDESSLDFDEGDIIEVSFNHFVLVMVSNILAQRSLSDFLMATSFTFPCTLY